MFMKIMTEEGKFLKLEIHENNNSMTKFSKTKPLRPPRWLRFYQKGQIQPKINRLTENNIDLYGVENV